MGGGEKFYEVTIDLRGAVDPRVPASDYCRPVRLTAKGEIVDDEDPRGAAWGVHIGKGSDPGRLLSWWHPPETPTPWPPQRFETRESAQARAIEIQGLADRQAADDDAYWQAIDEHDLDNDGNGPREAS